MLQIGQAARDFALPDTSGEFTRLGDLVNGRKAVVLAFYLLDFSGG